MQVIFSLIIGCNFAAIFTYKRNTHFDIRENLRKEIAGVAKI